MLISNAGVLSPNGRIHNLATEDWERAFRVNVLGAVNGIRAAVPRDARAAVGVDHPHGVGLRSHRVVARRAVLRDQGGRDPAREGRRGRVRRGTGSASTACAPGRSGSGIHADLPPEAIDTIAAKHPLGLGTAADLVGAYSYLASDASRWTTGSAIVVDGGYSAP